MPAIKTDSYWIESAPLPRYPRLDRNLKVDVAIVGGGITGLTAAALFKADGQSVAVLERDHLASADTGHTTGHLTCVPDVRLRLIARRFGLPAAKRVWEAGAAAIDRIVTFIRTERIACDFKWVPAYLHAPIGKEECMSRLFQADAKTARKLGIKADYVSAIPYFGVHGMVFPHQALFHPRKYLAALARRVSGQGSYILESSPVEEVKSRPLALQVGPYRVDCGYVVLATHTPLTGKTPVWPAAMLQSKLAHYTSYALSAEIPSGLLPEALFWDVADPYSYLRVERLRHFDYAIFGGEDHKTGQATDTGAAFRRLQRRFQRLVPDAAIEQHWSGQVVETNDGLPYIGETAPRQFAATGFSGNGLTFGTLAAMMAVDAAAKRKNPWQGLFDIHRRKVRGGLWDYVKENADYPYYRLRDWAGGTEGDSAAGVRRNQGKILNLDGKKTAVSRGADGKLTFCSPVCTHLQCIVGWNSAEKTWDCPCHGSRFKPTGEVISGPAEAPLENLTSRARTRKAPRLDLAGRP